MAPGGFEPPGLPLFHGGRSTWQSFGADGVVPSVHDTTPDRRVLI